MSGFSVRNPGVMTLIQDAGRFGYHHIGLTVGGPLDTDAFYWANRLCENPTGTAALEVTVGGLILEAQINTVLAVTGAAMALTINGDARACWRSHIVHKGDVIELGYALAGSRAYLAVAGGFRCAPMFGSVATVLREHIGGLRGEKLAVGDVLDCVPITGRQCWQLPSRHIPVYSKQASLRVVPGYQYQHFDRLAQRRFFSSEYTVSDRCDRMGYRLEGPAVNADTSALLSEGICSGAIQFPADGQPIVLLSDRQTIGGYPKIGAVITVDLGKLAQLMPGSTVSFEAVTVEQAHNALHLQESHYQRVQLQPVAAGVA